MLTNTEQFKELVKVQNDITNWNRDILTIVGFMSTIEELEDHLNKEKQMLANRK